MYRTLNDVIAMNGKNRLPMLPDVHSVYMSEDGTMMFGKKKRKRKTTKKRNGSKGRKVVRKRKTVKRKRKVVRKTVPKSLKNEAKKLGIKLTVKRGDKRIAKSEKVLRAQVRKQKAMKAKKSVKKVVKRRKTKRRVKRKLTKKSGFGTYWDNTQLLYAKHAASQQPAGTQGGNPYPYVGEDRPFFPIGGNAFGMPAAPMNRGMWNGQGPKYQPQPFQMPLNELNSAPGMVRGQTPMGQGVSRNYCKAGTQCGSFPRSVVQAYPFTTDNFTSKSLDKNRFGRKKKTARSSKRR